MPPQRPLTVPAVYDALLRRCPAYRLPGAWAAVAVDAAVRDAPADPAGVLVHLTEQFPPALLTQAGVACTTADNRLAPSDALRSEGPWLFLRPRPHAEPGEVLTPAGCLSGCDLPVLAALRDYPTAQALAAEPDRYPKLRRFEKRRTILPGFGVVILRKRLVLW